jgi:putative ABC transport system permease protein
LKEGGAGTAAVSKSKIRGGLIMAEVAVSVVLLTSGALLASSLLRVLNRPLGFNAAQAYTFHVNLPWDVSPSQITNLSNETLRRLNSLPGTIACGVVDRLPLHGGSQSGPLVVRGKAFAESIAEKEFGLRTASAGFFPAAGIPVLAGRLYRETSEMHEAVISQRLAQILFPGADPLGQEIAQRTANNSKHAEPGWFRIVGVVGSVPTLLANAEPAAELYVPWGATYWPMINFVVRTARPLTDVSHYVKGQIQPIDASQIFSPVATLEERTAETFSAPRIAAWLVGSFAVVALALSALGIFGLTAQETNRRTQEIGVRLALGGEPLAMALDALCRAVKPVLAGLAVGLCGAWYTGTLVKSLLFEVVPHDLSSYAFSVAVLLTAAVLASLAPALRAARINPIHALRHE